MRYQACLFDMNGVLVDDEHLQEEAFRQTLASLGHTLSHEDYQSYFIGKTDQKGFEDFFEAQGGDFKIDELTAQKSVEYKKLAEEGLSGYDGIGDFIRLLGQRGLKLGVVTSSAKPEAEAVLRSLGIRNAFTVLVTAENITHSKPDPEGYLLGASLLDVSPTDCLVVEDTPSGVAAAHSAGAFVIAVTNTHPKEELTHADIIVDQLSTVLVNRDLLKRP